MVLTFILILALIISASIVLQKWAKDSKREREEHHEKFNQYEDDWIKIHRD